MNRLWSSIAVIALALTISARAADVTVHNTADSGAGSLRQALIDVPPSGTIDFDASFSTPQAINLLSTLTATNAMTITGPGAGLLTVAGNNTFTILDTNSVNVSLSGMTITGGNGDGFTSTDLNSSTGGIVNFTATLTITGCTISGNRGAFAGGIFNGTGGTLTITGSTISGNTAVINPNDPPNSGFNKAGGISSDGTLNMTNCTVSGNSVTAQGECGGGILQFNGTSSITNCTVTDNSCTTTGDQAGGIRVTQGAATLFNSIVAANVNNTNAADVSSSAPGTSFVSSGHNLIGNVGSETEFNQAGDLTGTGAAPLDPLLAPLGNYGGPTQTHLIANNSPAVNAGSNAGAPATDQRGVARPFNVIDDIGAVEAQGIFVTTLGIPTGTAGTLYAGASFSGNGGAAPYFFTLGGALPNGMSISTNGNLAGTPTQSGSFPFFVIATDNNGFAGASFFTINVNPPPAPVIGGVVANQAVKDTGTIQPFSQVTITDASVPAQTLSVSVTLDTAAKGAFTAASLTASGFVNAGGGVYNFSGVAAAATAAIQQLVFAPTTGRVALGLTETTTFTISASDGIAPAVTNSATTVISTGTIASVVAIMSAPAATPSTAGVGQTVQFVAAASGGTGALTYSWNFGDGTPAASGANVSHAYTAAGIFTATVTITDANGVTASGSVRVTVKAPLVGTGNDSDGDGFSDAVEIEFGSSPTDPNSTPTGVTGIPVILPLTLSTVSIKLNFAKASADSATLTGTIPIPANFQPNGVKLAVIVAGVARVFTLTPKATGKINASTCRITLKSKKGVVAANPTAPFSVMLKNDALAASLAGSGLTNVDAKAVKATLVFTLIFQGSIYQKPQTLFYTAKKKQKSGAATKTKTQP